MSSKKPVVFCVLLIGILLCAVFISRFLLSFVDNSRLLLAIAETVAVVMGSMALFFGAVCFMAKRRHRSNDKVKNAMFNRPGSIVKMPKKGKEPIVIAMTRRG